MADNSTSRKNSIDILYIASHGLAVRMIIQTNLLGRLGALGLKVGLVAMDDQDTTLREYCDTHGVTLIAFNPASSFWSQEYLLMRRYLLEDIRKNPALWEKHLRFFESEGVSWKRKIKIRGYYALNKITQSFPFLKKAVLKFELSKLSFPEAEKIISTYNPALVVSTYPVNIMEASLLAAGKRQTGCKTVIHLLSWDNITCKGRFPVLADQYISWGEIMTSELQKYFKVDAKDIFTTGVPHFDVHHEISKQPKPQEYLVNLGLDPTKPYIFFAMSSPYFAPREIDIVEKIASWINEGIFGDIQFVIRPHPQNVQGNLADLSWLPRLKALVGNKIAVDFPWVNESKIPWSMQLGDMKKLANLIGGARVVINTCSTVSIDALFYNVPVISTAFDNDEILPWWQSSRRNMEYEHFAKLLRNGGVKEVNSYKELLDNLTGFIAHPEKGSDQRKIALNKECRIEENSMATDRVVDVLYRMSLN